MATRHQQTRVFMTYKIVATRYISEYIYVRSGLNVHWWCELCVVERTNYAHISLDRCAVRVRRTYPNVFLKGYVPKC
jgi:hypothetical protein